MKYHYTSILHFPFIVHSGKLRRSRRRAHGNHRRGLLWFSDNPVMEGTARKEHGAAVRFGSRASDIERWRNVAKAAGYGNAVMSGLERSGRKMGATPGQWWATGRDVDLDEIEVIEIRLHGQWWPIDLSVLNIREAQADVLELRGPGGLAAIVGRRRTASGFYLYGMNKDSYRPGNVLPGVALLEAAG